MPPITNPYGVPSMSARHLMLFVVRPTLAYLGDGTPGIASEAAAELLIGTAAQESRLRALDQWTGAGDAKLGPAIGLWQIEPATHDDLWTHFLPSRPLLKARLEALRAPWPAAHTQLATNLAYACAIARLVFFRSPVTLPPPGDIEAHAEAWKRVYNTPAGKGRPAEYLANWRELVAPYL